MRCGRRCCGVRAGCCRGGVTSRSVTRVRRAGCSPTHSRELDHDEGRLEAGRRFLDHARKRGGKDGRFAEPNRTEPSAQGASLLRLQVLDIYYPSFENGLSIGRGAEWLLAHAAEPKPSARGRSDNPGAAASPMDLVLALLYRGALADDPRAFTAADRAFRAIEPIPSTEKPTP